MAGAGSRKKEQTGRGDLEILSREIRERSFRRAYLLSGEERYLVVQYKNKLIEALIPKDDSMNLNIHTGRPDLSAVMDECMTMPFFAEKRVVVCDDTGFFAPSKKKKESGQSGEGENESSGETESALGESTQMLIDFLPKIPESTVLIFIEQAVDKRTKLYRTLARVGMAADFPHPDEETIRKWVLSMIKESRMQISTPALDFFLARTGNDMERVRGEYEKLVGYLGEGSPIRTSDIEKVVSVLPEDRIFDMIEAIGKGQRAEVFAFYDQLVFLRESPMKILALLTRQYTLLCQARNLLEQGRGMQQIMEDLGVKSSYIARKYLDLSRRFSAAELRGAMEACARTEEKIKTGRLDMTLGVELLIIRFSAHGQRT